MKRIFIFLFLVLSSQSFAVVSSGSQIKAKDIKSSMFNLGSIQQALLTQNQFQEENGDCWVQMEGQNIAGSDYATFTGISVLPNAQGRFLRTTGGDAPLMGQLQEDAIRNITGNLTGNRFDDGAAGTGAFKVVAGSGGTGFIGGSNGGRNLQFDASVSVPTAAENRPKNLGVNTFIKINRECNF